MLIQQQKEKNKSDSKDYTNKDVEQLLNLASIHPDYPDKKDSYFIMKEYDKSLQMVLLYVTDNFTEDQRSFLREFLKEHLNRRAVVSIIKSQGKFD